MEFEGLPILLWLALGAVLILQLVILTGLMLLGAQVRRLGRRSREPDFEAPAPPAPPAPVSARGRLFEAFLAEDPARRKLPKREQFAGFRRWRSERGLNWGSDES